MKNIFKFTMILTTFIVVLFGLTSCGKDKNYSQVTVTTNPEISFIVNSKNVVVSVKGENNDGKMIIEGEDLEGKKIDVALELVIKAEQETGFLVSGNIQANENNISVQVSADSSKVQAKLEAKVVASIEETCNDLHIEEKIEKVKALTKEELAKLVTMYDAFLTEVEIQKMNYDELLVKVADYHHEVIDLATVQLEQLYLDAKAYEFNLAKQNEIKVAIDKLDSKYQTFKTEYANLINSLEEAVDELEEVRYDMLVDPESSYQKALVEYDEAKISLNSLKAKLAAMDDANIAKPGVQALVTAGEITLNSAKLLMDSAEGVANQAINTCQAVIQNVIKEMTNLQNQFPEEIKTSLNEQAVLTDDFLNTTKTKFFEDFEKEYNKAIEEANKQIAERKTADKKAIEDVNK